MTCAAGVPLAQNIPVFIRKNAVGRVQVEVLDENGCPVDAASLVLSVLDGSDNPVYQEDFFQPFYPPAQHRIVKVAGTTGTYYIDWGDQTYPATLQAVGGVYPTGFVGGEKLRLQIDNEVQTVTFQATDQTLLDVIARINSVFGPLPSIGVPVAFDSGGQLLIRSKKTGRWAFVVVMVPGTDAAVATALGITLGSINMGTGHVGESSCTYLWLFDWSASYGAHSSEIKRIIQTVYVLPGVVFQMVPQLRLIIDKVAKLVDPKSGCFLGYTDQQLLQYIIGGLQTINAYQPCVYFTLDNFPYQQFGSVLLEAALMWGVTSQTLFAVDTDVTSYSDQGASFVINHQGPLTQYLNGLSARLDRMIPQFKLHFVNLGSTVTEMGPNFRLNQLLQSAPSGSLFRNVFARS